MIAVPQVTENSATHCHYCVFPGANRPVLIAEQARHGGAA